MIDIFDKYIYLLDLFKSKEIHFKIKIDNIDITENFKITVHYHTNKYNINQKITMEYLYLDYKKNLNTNEFEICQKILTCKKMFNIITDIKSKEKIMRYAKRKANEYEQS